MAPPKLCTPLTLGSVGEAPAVLCGCLGVWGARQRRITPRHTTPHYVHTTPQRGVPVDTGHHLMRVCARPAACLHAPRCVLACAALRPTTTTTLTPCWSLTVGDVWVGGLALCSLELHPQPSRDPPSPGVVLVLWRSAQCGCAMLSVPRAHAAICYALGVCGVCKPCMQTHNLESPCTSSCMHPKIAPPSQLVCSTVCSNPSSRG